MQISAIMNIHELAVNRSVKQREEAHGKKEQKEVKENLLQRAQEDLNNNGTIGIVTNPVQQQVDVKEGVQTETSVTGNIVDIHT